MRYKAIPKYELSDIDEVFLLSAEEWERARKIEAVQKYTGWWWLRWPGDYLSYAAYVRNDGSVFYIGSSVDCVDGAVRPAFKIRNLKSKTGDKVFVNNTLCTVTGTDVVFPDSVVCLHRFDPNANDYEKSEIKAFINSDEFKRML